MVSEYYSGDITSDEENELEDRVSNLEVKLEKMNSEIRDGIGAMKFEFQRKPTLKSDTPFKGLEVGRDAEAHLHKEGAARLENRGHQLEILESKDWESSLLDRLPPSQEGIATEHMLNFNVLATSLSVFFEAVKEWKRLKPPDLDENRELAQWNRLVFKWLNELALATPELTLTFEIPTKYDDIGIDIENRKHYEELWKFANQIRKLEVPSFKREDPKTNAFLDRKERETAAIYLDGEVVAEVCKLQ
ncbi:Hypothetical predicted protein [Olea europaea subsp. europaea]|uniref:Uncharacterized protein n=1 Tax=Olea europaea subsp. europaea TaxID=158383 RepID=A0A8S0U395_OLEEU|nr:Hypothetical predicted protein [Olea europaea subsp. europaea]